MNTYDGMEMRFRVYWEETGENYKELAFSRCSHNFFNDADKVATSSVPFTSAPYGSRPIDEKNVAWAF